MSVNRHCWLVVAGHEDDGSAQHGALASLVLHHFCPDDRYRTHADTHAKARTCPRTQQHAHCFSRA